MYVVSKGNPAAYSGRAVTTSQIDVTLVTELIYELMKYWKVYD